MAKKLFLLTILSIIRIGNLEMVVLWWPLGSLFICSNQLTSPKDLEVITVNICYRKPISLCTVYSPPNSSVEYQLNLIEYVHSLVQSSRFVIILGDFNVPNINWSSLSGCSTFSNALCDLIFDCNLIQLVNKPTHVKGNILDLVVTNSEKSIHDLFVISQKDQLINSDHFNISFSVDLSLNVAPKNKPKLVFDYPKANLEGLSNYLMDIDFSQSLTSNNIEQVWSFIKQSILDALLLFIPKVKL